MKNTNIEFQRRQLWINSYTAAIRAGEPSSVAIVIAKQGLITFDETFPNVKVEKKLEVKNEDHC